LLKPDITINGEPMIEFGYGGYNLEPDEVQPDAEMPQLKEPEIEIKVLADVQTLSIKEGEVLVVKSDTMTEETAKRLMAFFAKSFGVDMTNRMIVVPTGTDLEKLIVDRKKSIHPVYGSGS